MASPLITKQGLHRVDFPACTANACHQGAKSCPCPDACHIPADDFDPSKPNVLASAVKYGLIVACFIGLGAAPLFFR